MGTFTAAFADIRGLLASKKPTYRLKIESDFVAYSVGLRNPDNTKINVVKDNMGKGDAFRHAYSAAKSTYEYGALLTEVAGYINEGIERITVPMLGDDKQDSSLMDIHNNNVGIEIGKEVTALAKENNWNDTQVRHEIGQRVLNKINSGDMIILQGDKKTPDDQLDDALEEVRIETDQRINQLTTGNILDLVNNVVNHSVAMDPLSPYHLTRPDMGNVPTDPLVVDLNGDGIHLTAAENGTAFFDIDNDGIREQVGWISAGDGLIVRDLNNNGTIDDIGELIGTETEDAYTVLDGFDLNNDNKINNQDAVWSSLKVWQDSNGNAGELRL